MAKKKIVKKAKKATRAKAKKAKKATSSGYAGPAMPQKSAASKKGGARPVGTKSGEGVTATWISLFDRNEKASRAKKMTDKEITAEMNRNFPGRKSAVFNNVTGVRSAFRRQGIIDASRYDENGDVIEKGKRLASNGKPTKGKKATRPAKKAKKAKRPVKK